jgi:glutaryl-CoA dehydrogenase (non-decarboxylating)
VIDFTLTDEHKLVRASARSFVEAEILPYIREWDEKGEVHREIFAKMAEMGFLGAPIPERYGGACARSWSVRTRPFAWSRASTSA